MKYRRLQLDELQEMEADFIDFLAANTVTGPDWEKLKAEKPEKANELIDIFSDIVFDKVLKKVEYLEFKTPKDLKTFHCQTDKIVMRGMMVQGESSLDFTKNPEPDQIMNILKETGAKLQLYRAEKVYKDGNREAELFRMMENGCLISKGELYRSLESLQKKKS